MTFKEKILQKCDKNKVMLPLSFIVGGFVLSALVILISYIDRGRLIPPSVYTVIALSIFLCSEFVGICIIYISEFSELYQQIRIWIKRKEWDYIRLYVLTVRLIISLGITMSLYLQTLFTKSDDLKNVLLTIVIDVFNVLKNWDTNEVPLYVLFMDWLSTLKK